VYKYEAHYAQSQNNEHASYDSDTPPRENEVPTVTNTSTTLSMRSGD